MLFPCNPIRLATRRRLAGRPDLALRTCDEAVELSRALSPRALSVTLLIKLILLTSMRNREGALACSRELLALSDKHSYEFWKSSATFPRR